MVVNKCANALFFTIPATVQDLAEYLKVNQDNPSTEVTWNVISAIKAADIRTQMEQACMEIMEVIITVYSADYLPMIFNAVPEASHLKSRYMLTQDYITQQSLNGQNGLKRNLSPVYSELSELARVQEQLISQFPQLEAAAGDNSTDWGLAARNFLGGVMTTVNPLIGVPILISNYYNGNEKDKSTNAALSSWSGRFEDYLKRWDKTCALYYPVYEAQCRFIEEKMNTMSEVAIPGILSALDAEGYNLKQVPVTFQRHLNDIKQKFEIK